MLPGPGSELQRITQANGVCGLQDCVSSGADRDKGSGGGGGVGG